MSRQRHDGEGSQIGRGVFCARPVRESHLSGKVYLSGRIFLSPLYQKKRCVSINFCASPSHPEKSPFVRICIPFRTRGRTADANQTFGRAFAGGHCYGGHAHRLRPTGLAGLAGSYDDENDDDASSPPPAEPDPKDPKTWPVSEDGTTLIVPSGATSDQITKNLLETHPGITSLDLRNSGVTSIGASAFQGCTSLNSVTLPDDLTSIGNSAFQGCTSLNSVTLPDGLTSIGNSAFAHCSSLESIDLPDDLTSLGSGAFQSTGLTSIDFPTGLQSIGNDAFFFCKNLESVSLPEGLTSIGVWAFQNCTSLTSVTLPDSLTSIGNFAFYNCTGLTSIRFGTGIISDGATIGVEAFDGVPANVIIYYPSGVDVEALKAKLQEAGLNTGNYTPYEEDTKMLQTAPAAPGGVKELLDTVRAFGM